LNDIGEIWLVFDHHNACHRRDATERSNRVEGVGVTIRSRIRNRSAPGPPDSAVHLPPITRRRCRDARHAHEHGIRSRMPESPPGSSLGGPRERLRAARTRERRQPGVCVPQLVDSSCLQPCRGSSPRGASLAISAPDKPSLFTTLSLDRHTNFQALLRLRFAGVEALRGPTLEAMGDIPRQRSAQTRHVDGDPSE
jgi:hypothetical protein